MRSVLCLVAVLLSACMPSSAPVSNVGRAGVVTAPSPRATVEFPAIRFDTNIGSFTAVLYPEIAPDTVARYQEYVESGYFVGRSFDRVIPGFVIQLTDCAISFLTRDTRTLFLEPGYAFAGGALGIARSASENSGGPEFFVMDFAAAQLNQQYTVFGQVIEGMDVIHRAARVMAVDFTAGGQVPFPLGDRCALQPVEITATQLVTVTLSADAAARLPLQTAERIRTDTAAYNLEWPASLAKGRASDFTLYIRMVDESQSPPAAQDLSVTIAGVSLPLTAGDVAGVYRFDWTPKAAGVFDAVIGAAGAELAVLKIEVR